MTDEQIIKALECDLALSVKVCPECPYFRKRNEDTHCSSILLQDALDLIKRQKAEIEKLQNLLDLEKLFHKEKQAECNLWRYKYNKALNQLNDYQSIAKAEAVKEFAERLKEYYIKDKRYDRPYAHTMISALFNKIDNLVKEMAGDAE